MKLSRSPGEVHTWCSCRCWGAGLNPLFLHQRVKFVRNKNFNLNHWTFFRRDCSRKDHFINFIPEPCENVALTCFGVSARWELSHRTYFYAELTKKTTNASRMPRSCLRSCLLSRLEAALKQREMVLDCVYLSILGGLTHLGDAVWCLSACSTCSHSHTTADRCGHCSHQPLVCIETAVKQRWHPDISSLDQYRYFQKFILSVCN